MRTKQGNRFYNWLAKILLKVVEKQGPTLIDFERLCYEIRPGDVLLVSGKTRLSSVIKTITQSQWSHASLYLGRLGDIEDPKLHAKITQNFKGSDKEQLIIESELGRGTYISTLDYYKNYHIRICRPRGLSRYDTEKVIAFAINHIGKEYDLRQILDLARFFFPWRLLPRRWYSSLFHKNIGVSTKESCSLLIGNAFTSVDFPILPLVQRSQEGNVEFIRRNPKLYVPADFDNSPYFDIVKYPMYELEATPRYRKLPWRGGMLSDNEGNVYAIDEETGEEILQPTIKNIAIAAKATEEQTQNEKSNEENAIENVDIEVNSTIQNEAEKHEKEKTG
ncbi:MAG: YiiX/YebB-like N1pC/P60 family cysteine hydrolase [Pseudomonadota bacterium]